MAARDWVGWHDEYADPASSLSRRRAVVQAELRKALDGRDGPTRLISMCAGDGGDVLPVLAEHPAGHRTRALLVELDPELAARAGTTPMDAGTTDPYLAYGRAHVLLACGVFGNIGVADARRTIATIPGLTEPGATVIWTRAGDASEGIRELFAEYGFRELGFTKGDRFRVGVHTVTTVAPPPAARVRMFRFRENRG